MLKDKIKKINAISEKIKSLRKNELPLVPTDKEIEKLSQSQMRIEVLKESLTARGLAVTVRPGEKGSLEVEVDGERLKAGRLDATGTESVDVGAPGLGKVTVKAKLEQARDAKVALRALRQGRREQYR